MLKRAFGIAGSNTERARIVINAANELTRESRELNAQLSKYASAEDPFGALVTDLANHRAWRGYGQRKPQSPPNSY